MKRVQRELAQQPGRSATASEIGAALELEAAQIPLTCPPTARCSLPVWNFQSLERHYPAETVLGLLVLMIKERLKSAHKPVL
ncbi:MAG: hypothetical protein ACKO24_16995 [Leptolyngbyaceae cyanobacterium]